MNETGCRNKEIDINAILRAGVNHTETLPHPYLYPAIVVKRVYYIRAIKIKLIILVVYYPWTTDCRVGVAEIEFGVRFRSKKKHTTPHI